MTVRIDAPRIEHHREPLGIGEPRRVCRGSSPRAPSGWRQAAYAVEVDRGGRVARRPPSSRASRCWSPGRTSRCGPASAPGARPRAGEDGAWSEWSRPDDRGSRTARAVRLGRAARGRRVEGGPAIPTTGAPRSSAPTSRSRGLVARPAVRDRAWTVRGGAQRIARRRRALSPGWTVYPKRLRYYTYDVTDLLRPGRTRSAPGSATAGTAGGSAGAAGFRNVFGDDLSFLGQLELTYADGAARRWRRMPRGRPHPAPSCAPASTTARTTTRATEPAGWSSAGFDDDAWEAWPCATATRERSSLPPPRPCGAPRRCVRSRCSPRPRGARILDFGQNLVGRVRIRVRARPAHRAPAHRRGAAGRRALHAPAAAGALDRPLHARRPADGEEWEPRFTFHGFRYVEVDGWPGDLDAAVAAGDLVARVLPHRPRAHRLVRVVRSAREPPARERRVGHARQLRRHPHRLPAARRAASAGPATSRSSRPTASFLYDASGMLTGWLAGCRRRAAAGRHHALVRAGDPRARMWTPIRPGAAWGDVATLTPWTLYERFGDRGCSTRSSTARAAGSTSSTALAGPDRLWNTGFQLGDWLDPAAPPQDPADARTDRYLVATAYFAKSARTVSRMADGARSHRRRGALCRARGRGRRRVRRRVRAAGRPDDQRRADRVRAGHRVRPDPRRRAPRRGRRAARRARARRQATASRPDSSGRRWSPTR